MIAEQLVAVHIPEDGGSTSVDTPVHLKPKLPHLMQLSNVAAMSIIAVVAQAVRVILANLFRLNVNFIKKRAAFIYIDAALFYYAITLFEFNH